MRKEFLFSVMILLGALILISGCGSSNAAPGNVKYNFQTGIGELNLKFLTNAPPEKIYPFSSFKMILDLENQAGYDLNNGKVRIVGLDEKYFKLDQTEQTFQNLEGRNMINPLGGRAQLEFNGEAHQLFSSSEQYVGNYFLQASYDSKMDFVDTVCLNPNFYEVFDAGCKSNSKKSYTGQGAPLAIASLDQITSPSSGSGGEIEFRLTVKNKGIGKVENVTLVKSQLGGENIICGFVGSKNKPLEEQKSLSFDDKLQEGVLICKSALKGGDSYSTTLYLGFTYKYRWEQRQKLTLVK